MVINNRIKIQWGRLHWDGSSKNSVSGEVYYPISFNSWYSIVGTCNDHSDIISFTDLSNVSKASWVIYERLPEYMAYPRFIWLAVGY